MAFVTIRRIKERPLQEQWDIVGWIINLRWLLIQEKRIERIPFLFLSLSQFIRSHTCRGGGCKLRMMALMQFQKKLTQFQGGNMKREEDAENLWMNDFWNRMDTVQKVWKRTIVNCVHKRPKSDEDEQVKKYDQLFENINQVFTFVNSGNTCSKKGANEV